jgi:hypothetical protein
MRKTMKAHTLNGVWRTAAGPTEVLRECRSVRRSRGIIAGKEQEVQKDIFMIKNGLM